MNKIKQLIASTLFFLGLIRLSSWIRLRVFAKPRITILCYHRIVNEGGLISPQCVSAEMFEEQVKYFSKHSLVLGLDEVTQFLSAKRAVRQDIVVFTFDDGYEDNYSQAAPILDKYGVKACFFVASDPILEGKNYWIDELSSILDKLDRQNIGAIRSFTEQSVKIIQKFLEASASDRSEAAKVVFRYANNLPLRQRNEFIEGLGTCVSSALEVPALMTAEQLKALRARGHSIGAHTVTHPRLSVLSEGQMIREVAEGISALRQQITPVNFFAYPFGKLDDLPKNHATLFELLEEQGIELAVTTEDAAVEITNAPYLLNRKVISAQPLPQISLKLEILKWQHSKKNL